MTAIENLVVEKCVFPWRSTKAVWTRPTEWNFNRFGAPDPISLLWAAVLILAIQILQIDGKGA